MNKVFGNKKSIAVFVLPAFCIYFIFCLVPIVYNFYISLFQTDMMSPGKFVGIQNYVNLFKDGTFLKALRNNILMVMGSLIAHLPLALFFGNLLFQKIKGSHFFQTVFFLPSVICGVAVGMIWTFVYNSEFGLLNKMLEMLGLVNLQQAWLSNKKVALICVIVVVMWQFVGYHMVIQLAAMKNIPESLYEAAKIDGASKWVQFRSITFPLIKNILKVDAVLIITGSLKYYDLIAVMTGGGPNHSTELMSTYMYYQGFRTLKYGYSAAIGVILLLLCICAVWISNHVFKSEPIEF
ncbi:carbohydrate ABC transporter permease [Kineothrix sp. MB12-C1]|uniref:carbohydrate ABC transporter permease n=1 Tax=Kineothrix sp. MB12-C1 TaxID=3070215 RepID=UPI0027D2A95D|nr:sugar ABC transporter permease [Kineothrix sp. MB12-C1]WMC93288.1 sugar ABC transporter permease [Kineothrix sp. MB12-C1]